MTEAMGLLHATPGWPSLLVRLGSLLSGPNQA